MPSARFTVHTHFVLAGGDDYICKAAPIGPGAVEVMSDLSDLGNCLGRVRSVHASLGNVLMVEMTFIAPDGTEGNTFINAYFVGDPQSYVAVETGKYGVIPLSCFDRDYALYLEAVDSCNALEN
tara:strand:+ start:4914 stop:5285 length:372 start_codon:yes stop_codon:yes gene_type:complete